MTKKSATWPLPRISRRSFCFSITTIRATIQHYRSITCVNAFRLYPIWAVFAYTIIFIIAIIYSKRAKRIKAVHFFAPFSFIIP